MKFLGLEISRNKPEEKSAAWEALLRSLIAAQGGSANLATPENCMKSPTVHAIVTAISRRISVSPVHVYQKKTAGGKDSKERLPSHPVAKLLQRPNGWQTKTDYWLDAVSAFLRYGRYFAYKSRGSTGPIRDLIPLLPSSVVVEQNEKTYAVTYKVNGTQEVPQGKMHYVRGPARDFLNGDSPVKDVGLAIALEIAAEEYGATFFANGAMPLIMFQYMQGVAQSKDGQAEKNFVEQFQSMFGGNKRHKAMVVPRGMEVKDPIKVENDKAQMLETRKYQRTVIAGAFGVPPHLVGDLERATFNNVEQQDADFTSNVIQPVVQAFESAMERDLLTDEDRSGGIIIRFNLDSILRADFKSRQEGSRIQRDAGVISANEWREREGLNPISNKKGGDDYMRPANMMVAGEEPKEQPDNNNAEAESTPRDQEPK